MKIVTAQRGATLVVTLVILVVITVIGLTALRGSSLNLAIATNSQIRTLLREAVDVGAITFEQKVLEDTAAAVELNGVLDEPMDMVGSEFTYCFNNGSFAQCSGTTPVYLTGRNVTQVQVGVLVPTDGVQSAKPDIQGVDADEVLVYKVRAVSTAVMPGVGNATASEIAACLSKRDDDLAAADPSAVTTTTECLNEEGAMYSTTVQEYCYSSYCDAVTQG